MSTNLPSQVLIIRHGEKLGDAANDKSGGPHLSMQGSARAAALPSLFVPATPPLSCDLKTGSGNFTGHYKPEKNGGGKPRFDTPKVLFATENGSHSHRPVETITPTSIALGLTINSNGYPNSPAGIQALMNEINSGTYAGQVVLVCWHHGTIPAVASALGIAKPPKWKGTVFDRVWQITWSSKGAAKLKDHPQRLLYGDSAK